MDVLQSAVKVWCHLVLMWLHCSLSRFFYIMFLLLRSPQKAASGAEATRDLKARAGRASYISPNLVSLPDPGAVAVATILKAILEVLEGRKWCSHQDKSRGLMLPKQNVMQEWLSFKIFWFFCDAYFTFLEAIFHTIHKVSHYKLLNWVYETKGCKKLWQQCKDLKQKSRKITLVLSLKHIPLKTESYEQQETFVAEGNIHSFY